MKNAEPFSSAIDHFLLNQGLFNRTLLGIDLISSSVTASVMCNATSGMGSTTTYTYCNATVAYTHTGKGGEVVLKYADATDGLGYGAVGGATDAGYDAFSNSYDEVVLYSNRSINWDATHMFGYQALGEMTLVTKALTKSFYGTSSDAKIYTYYEGCSDGGREGVNQVLHWGEQYDGVISRAPAFRFAQQQVLHIFSSMVEDTLGYYPPPYELDKMVNAIIAAYTDDIALGGKLLHYHGESDSSIPAASSERYWQSVRSVMYGDMSQEKSLAALEDWYPARATAAQTRCSPGRTP
ncbi:hypothetical protein QQZ08_005067 [Neonectria magnoliae]|uniref:Carboxylic ester hydrolase n=1 Tax=Neonectria magnoliae TaxID=2732573 RepID=A0ABR1I6C7_9HYPO